MPHYMKRKERPGSAAATADAPSAAVYGDGGEERLR